MAYLNTFSANDVGADVLETFNTRRLFSNRDPRVGAFAADVRHGYSTNLVFYSDSKLYSRDNGTAGSAVNRLADDLATFAPVDIAIRPMIYQIDFNINLVNGTRSLHPRRMVQTGNPGYRIFRADTANGMGSYGNVASVLPASGVLESAGDLRFRFNFRPTNTLTPAVKQVLYSRNGGGGLRGYELGINTAGDLEFFWFPTVDAATAVTVTLTQAQLQAAGFPLTLNAWNSIELYIDVDNGSGGYTVTWGVGTPFTDVFTAISAATVTTTTGITTIAQPAINHYVGGRAGNPAGALFEGDIEQMWVFDGFWKLLTPPGLESWNSAGGLPDDKGFAGTGTIRVFNFAYPGTQPAAWLGAANAAYLSNIPYGVGIIATADNQNEADYVRILAAIQAFHTVIDKPTQPFQLAVILPNGNLAGAAAGTHGPKTQMRKISTVRKFAAQANLPICDMELAFALLADRGASLIKTDKQHPTNLSRTTNGGDGQEFILKGLKQFLGI